MFDLDLGTPSSGPFKDGEPNVKDAVTILRRDVRVGDRENTQINLQYLSNAPHTEEGESYQPR